MLGPRKTQDLLVEVVRCRAVVGVDGYLCGLVELDRLHGWEQGVPVQHTGPVLNDNVHRRDGLRRRRRPHQPDHCQSEQAQYFPHDSHFPSVAPAAGIVDAPVPPEACLSMAQHRFVARGVGTGETAGQGRMGRKTP